MQVAADRTDASTAIQTDLPAIFASLELSRSTWLITSLSPSAGEKMSKHSIRAGDVAGLLVRLAQLKEKARGRLRKTTIVALARKLLVALWKYVTAGVVIEGAIVPFQAERRPHRRHVSSG